MIIELFTYWVRSVVDVIKHLTDYWLVKTIITTIGFYLIDVFGAHIAILLLFAILECCDCITKFLALSYKNIQCNVPDAQPTLVECLRGIPAAHIAGIINSQTMRNQFFSKMLTYLLLIIVSGVGDKVITLTHRPEFLLNVVVTYISSTELLSCLENLNDANVSMATSLMAQVKRIAHIDDSKEPK